MRKPATLEPEKMLVPRPRDIKRTGETFVLSKGVVLLLSPRAQGEDVFAASHFQEQVKAELGVKIRVCRDNRIPDGRHLALMVPGMARSSLNPDFRPSDLKWIEEAPHEAYLLRVAKNVQLASRDSAGFYYGLQTLAQLLRAGRNGNVPVPGMIVKDWPALRHRGIVCDTRWQIAKPGYLKRIVQTLGAFKVNMMLFYNENMIKLDKHPELAPRCAYSHNDIRELVRFARKHHVEIVPSFNSFGHWSDQLCRHYAHLSESQSGGGPFCPSNEGTYKLLAEIYAELVPLFDSDYFWIGCDEVRPIGECPRCRKMMEEIGKNGLFIMHVKRLHQMLKEYGKKAIMDADFFSSHADRDAKGADFTGTLRGLDELPRDVVCLDWTGAPDIRGSRIGAFQQAGHDVLAHAFAGCMERVFPAYQERIKNIRRYVKEAIRHDAWGEVTAGYELFCRFFEYFWYGLIYSAELAWSGDVGLTLEDYDRKFSFQFFGLGTNELTRAIHLLADCNVFDNSGGAVDPFPTWEVFKDIASAPYSFMERDEIFARIRAIPDKAERALRLVERARRKVVRNNVAVDFLALAAKRFLHESRKVLLVEEAGRNYREGWRAQWPMWFPEGLVEVGPDKVKRKMKRAVELLKELRAEVGPLREEVRRLWLWHRKTYRLKEWFLDFYGAQEEDLTEKIDQIESCLEKFAQDGPGVFPMPSHVRIFQGPQRAGRKRRRFVPWGP
ncbi:MAG: family 20 glycosylhydrolase [Planctomycetota bacterium]